MNRECRRRCRPQALRRAPLVLAVAVLLALPATSFAGDPLLSGYGGPGGGQQALLGGHLLARPGSGSGGGSGSAGGSLRAAAPATPAPSSGATSAAPASPAASSSAPQATAPTAHRRPRASRKAPRHAPHRHAKAHGGAADAAPATVVTPRRVAYPTRADDAGGFPLGAGELLVGALALLAIVSMGLWLRGAAGTGRGGGAQGLPRRTEY